MFVKGFYSNAALMAFVFVWLRVCESGFVVFETEGDIPKWKDQRKRRTLLPDVTEANLSCWSNNLMGWISDLYIYPESF